MARPDLPIDGEKPYGTKLRAGINDVSDRADTAITNAANASTAASNALNRANHTGTQSADTVVAGSTNGVLTLVEKTKLAAIAANATANSSDATLLNRTNHTGTQLSSTISDLVEFIQDTVAAFFVAGTNVTLAYNDAANTLTISATGGSGGGTVDETTVMPIVGPKIVGSGVVTAAYNSSTRVVTITTTATANDTDANLKARANHTGTQSADTLTDGSTNRIYTTTEKSKLAGISTAATANSTDATLLSRANHTGTQTSATISDFASAVAALITGKENTITAGTTSQYFRGDKTFVTLDKTAVGLNNVDNTADTAKPVSSAQQTALNLKANLASPALTGIPTVPTAPAGTSSTQAASTAFVATNFTPLVGTVMRITGYGTTLPGSGVQAGDIFFLQA